MRIILILIMIFISFRLYAPVNEGMLIFKSDGINPFEDIWKAICQVESSNNPFAYHLEKNGFASIGIVQIQQSRISHFKAISGIDYNLMDMYCPEKAKRVFIWYASEIGIDYERIAREWNGGSNGMQKKSTLKYWMKVRELI